ncbi:MAG: YqgE/AlgH family protein [Tannerella sp.]|jgi:putative transcriptional regulator|nr:YqgE/AlgH family protein [Tannerella sp.]
MANEKDLFQIKHNDLRPQKGRILISEPFMQDIFFRRAVILLVDHSSKGSMGFILNKRTGLHVNDFFPEFGDLPKIPIYFGGPVVANHLFFLHLLGDIIIPESISINKNLCFDGRFDAIKQYILDGNKAEGNVKFFLGYSGWEENQLNSEIISNSWLVAQTKSEYMIQANDDTFWADSLKRLGSPYNAWANYPLFPQLN